MASTLVLYGCGAGSADHLARQEISHWSREGQPLHAAVASCLGADVVVRSNDLSPVFINDTDDFFVARYKIDAGDHSQVFQAEFRVEQTLLGRQATSGGVDATCCPREAASHLCETPE